MESCIARDNGRRSKDVDGFRGSFVELLIEKDDDGEGANEKNEEAGFVFFPTSRSISVSSSTSEAQMLCFGVEEDDDDGGVVSVDHNCKPRARMKTVSSIGMGGGGCAKFGPSISSKRKKTKVESLPVSRTSQMGREKMGSHVRALQQLVSPMGKSDTASVLQEAFGYIRFLHDQVKVLSSAYMEEETELAMESDWREGYLRKRGLCLVPVSRTVIMAGSNSADIWAPASSLNMDRSAAISPACSKF